MIIALMGCFDPFGFKLRYYTFKKIEWVLFDPLKWVILTFQSAIIGQRNVIVSIVV